MSTPNTLASTPTRPLPTPTLGLSSCDDSTTLSDPVAIAIHRMQLAGFDLDVVNGHLAVSPAARLSHTQREWIKDHKIDILAALLPSLATSPETTAPAPPSQLTEQQQADILEARNERAAIKEHGGHLPRELAEQQAAAAIRVYHYRLTDNPHRWLCLIAPGCELADAHRTLNNRFGIGRVIEVKRHHTEVGKT